MRELTQNLVVYGRGKNCRLEIGRQVDGEHIGRFVRWTRRLWIRRAQGYEGWIQAIPYARLRVSGFGGDRIDSGNALEIRQRWHVHKRKTRHPRVSDHVQKRTHRVVQVLWLLHRQYDEVVVRRIDRLRCFGIEAPGEVGRAEAVGGGFALERQQDLCATGVDQLGRARRQTRVTSWTAMRSLVLNRDP